MSTVEHPQRGKFWRLLDTKELKIFTETPEQYGCSGFDPKNPAAPNIKELAKCNKVKDKKCIRCCSSAKGILVWELSKPGAQVLTIDMAQLNEDEFETVEGLPDIYVVGAAAVRAGKLITLEEAKGIASES